MRTTGQTRHRLDRTPAEPVTARPVEDALPVDDALAVAASVDDADSPRDVMDLLALAAFTTGREPFAHSAFLENVRVDAPLRPEGGRLARAAVDGDSQARLTVGEGWTLQVVHWPRTHRATVVACAVSAELASSIVERTVAGAVADPPPADRSVPIGFWHLSPRGPRRTSRPIGAAPWPDLRRNYPAPVAAALARVEVGPLSAEEARAWLGTTGAVGPATLAELYARGQRRDRVEVSRPPAPVGLYL